MFSILNTVALNTHQTLISSLLTLVMYINGLITTPIFWVIILFMICDFILGLYAAWRKGEIDWDVCLHGIASKVYIGMLILISAAVDFGLSFYGINTGGIFHKFIMAAILTRELGSIIKNADKGGFWMPDLLKEANKRLSDFSKSANLKSKSKNKKNDDK